MNKHILLISIIFFTACDFGRTPSKTRFERICNIELPEDYKVIKDEYQDMLQDYAIIWEIQLSEKSKKELISKIIKSYCCSKNESIERKETKYNNEKMLWFKSDNGYTVHVTKERTEYWIHLDTITNKLVYEESYD